MLFEYFQFALVFGLTQICVLVLASYVILTVIFSERGIKWCTRKMIRMTREMIMNIMFEIEDEESN